MGVKVLVKKPNEELAIIELKMKSGEVLENFDELYKIIGCDIIEQLSLKPNYGMVMFLDEEGKLKGLNPNILLNLNGYHELIVGTFVICSSSTKDAELYIHDINADDLEYFTNMIKSVYYEK